MEGSGSSGFDISKMSTAEKLLAGGSILLLIDSFFAWQSVDLGGLEDHQGRQLHQHVAGERQHLRPPRGTARDRAHRRRRALHDGLDGEHEYGHDVRRQAHRLPRPWCGGIRLLKFLLVVTNSPGWAAFVGLVLLVAIGWGAWQKVQTSGGFQWAAPAAGRWAAGHPTVEHSAAEHSAAEHTSKHASAYRASTQRRDAPSGSSDM